MLQIIYYFIVCVGPLTELQGIALVAHWTARVLGVVLEDSLMISQVT